MPFCGSRRGATCPTTTCCKRDALPSGRRFFTSIPIAGWLSPPMPGSPSSGASGGQWPRPIVPRGDSLCRNRLIPWRQPQQPGGWPRCVRLWPRSWPVCLRGRGRSSLPLTGWTMNRPVVWPPSAAASGSVGSGYASGATMPCFCCGCRPSRLACAVCVTRTAVPPTPEPWPSIGPGCSHSRARMASAL